MKKLLLVTFLVFACIGGVLAQQPPAPKPEATAPKVEAAKPEAKIPAAPVMSEVRALKIENAMLKWQAGQQNADKLKADFQALLTEAQVPGFQIAQGVDGKLGYVPEPKVEKTAPK